MTRWAVRLEFEAQDVETGSQLMIELQEFLALREANPQIVPVSQPAGQRAAIYTDGGCDRLKNGVGAWAYSGQHPDGRIFEASGGMMGTTNNRMEMMALKRLLEDVEIGTPLDVYSDSQYLVKGLTMWVRNWIRNGWRTREGKEVLNQDLWKPLVDLYGLHDVALHHVAGHSGVTGNEAADAMCSMVMTDIHKRYLEGWPVDYDPMGKDAAAPTKEGQSCITGTRI